MSEKPRFVVIFQNENGFPYRNILDLKEADPRLDNRTFNRVMREAKKMGATNFTILQAIPRFWQVDYKTNCEECGRPNYDG